MSGVDQFDNMTKAITKTGAAADLAAAMMEGLPGVVENIQSSFETAAIAAIEPFKDDIINIGKAIAGALSAFANLPEPIRKIIVVMAGVVALIGPVLVFVGTLLTMAGTVINAIGVLSGLGISIGGIITFLTTMATSIFTVVIPAIAALVAPFLPVIATVAIVAGVIYLLYLAWKKNLGGIQDIVRQSAAGWKLAFQRFGEWWKEHTKQMGEDVQGTFAGMGTGVQGSFQKTIEWIKTAWQNFMTFLRNLPATVVNYIVKTFQGINWSTIGKNILLGLANGMLLGLPNLLVMAKKVADDLLAQIKRSLGIHSPSAEMMKLGAFTAQGFMMGMQRVSPDDMARSLVKPITNMNSTQQQNITMQFASGLTLRDVHNAIAQNNEQFMNMMNTALGGA